MSDKAALRGRWGATNHDFDFRKYNTFAEQIAKEQDAQIRAAEQNEGRAARDGANAYGHQYTTGNYQSASGEARDIDWGKQRAKPRPVPITGVPRPRFHNRGGDGTRRHWDSTPEPLVSTEIGGWWGKEIYTDIDYDGLKDADEAAGIDKVRAHAQGPQIDARDRSDEALLRSINGRRDNFGTDMYTVVNIENTGYML